MPDSGSTLRLYHLPGGALSGPPAQGHWLGGACFGGCSGTVSGDGPPLAHVRMQPLSNGHALGAACTEAWAVDGPVRQGKAGALRWACDDHWWFGVVQFDEPERVQAGTPLEQVTRDAYAQLFETMTRQGFTHLVRVWNHIADINGGEALERYRQFNVGRQDVFLNYGREVAGASVPAASALGVAAQSPFVLYALAARQPAKTIENPRQVSAYAYPETYGPRTPTFSRAALTTRMQDRVLFISGTASIVGHLSMHGGDVLEQTRETLRNLATVLEQARDNSLALSLSDLVYKVYVRHVADWPQVHAELRQAVGEQAQILALQADICRSDLLVEIEAVGFEPNTGKPDGAQHG